VFLNRLLDVIRWCMTSYSAPPDRDLAYHQWVNAPFVPHFEAYTIESIRFQ